MGGQTTRLRHHRGGVTGVALLCALAAHAGRWLLGGKGPSLAPHADGRDGGFTDTGLYSPGTLRARSATVGAPDLYAHCVETGARHRIVGTLVAAGTHEEGKANRRLADTLGPGAPPDLA